MLSSFSNEEGVPHHEGLSEHRNECCRRCKRENERVLSALCCLPPADVKVDKRQKTLGAFSNPEAASLAYARHIGRDEALKAQAAYDASLAADAPLTAEQVVEVAQREGLTLELAPGSKSGYKGVSFDERAKKGKAFLACFTTPGAKGKQQHLGSFHTVEEAALHHARRQAEFERMHPEVRPKMGFRGHTLSKTNGIESAQ